MTKIQTSIFSDRKSPKIQLTDLTKVLGLSDDNSSPFKTPQNFNLNSTEFVPKKKQSDKKLVKLAKQLNNLGILDDDDDKFDDSGMISQFDSKSPSKSHNSSSSSGFYSSINSGVKSGLEISLDEQLRREEMNKTVSEHVEVPTSEHVAEIVGKQGCKIKALRTKTSTYIKTPARGEDPYFVITGKKCDVDKAVKEIKEAADHFTMIRARRSSQRQINAITKTRKPLESPNNDYSIFKQISPPPPGFNLSNRDYNNNIYEKSRSPSPIRTHDLFEKVSKIINQSDEEYQETIPEFGGYTIDNIDPMLLSKQITLKVRVPYKVVGLVVGLKGQTIKQIQQKTQTFIVTPSKNSEPVFEITGLQENAELARAEIQSHIAVRTGTESIDADEDFRRNGNEDDYDEFNTIPDWYNNDPIKSSTKSPIDDLFTPIPKRSNLSPINVWENKSQPLHPLKCGFDIDLDKNSSSSDFEIPLDEQDSKNEALKQLNNLTEIEKIKLGKVIEDLKMNKNGKNNENAPSIFDNIREERIEEEENDGNVLISKLDPETVIEPVYGRKGRKNFTENHTHINYTTVNPENPYQNQDPGRLLLQKVAMNAGPPRFMKPDYNEDYYNNYSSNNPYASIHEGYPENDSYYGYGGECYQDPYFTTVHGVNKPGKCLVCRERQISMALVPCGHNLFCEECAFKITHQNKTLHSNPVCPECFEPVNMAIRIKM